MVILLEAPHQVTAPMLLSGPKLHIAGGQTQKTVTSICYRKVKPTMTAPLAQEVQVIQKTTGLNESFPQ